MRILLAFALVPSFLLAASVAALEGAVEGHCTDNQEEQAEEKAAKTEPAKKQRPKRKGLGPGELLVLRFDRDAPQIGDPLPDVAGFDADGEQFPLRNLKGHYSVLVFGCLT